MKMELEDRVREESDELRELNEAGEERVKRTE